MDPLTQGALGAVAAGAGARRAEITVATALGFLAGMAPDLDVLIRSDTDPLLVLDYHRQFTHALAFVPLGALACAALAFPLARRWLSFGRCYLFCVLGLASHGLLDACTSFGTQLLWPFSDARVAWNRLAVVDPLITLPLLALLAAAVIRHRRWWLLTGLTWVGCYLCVASIQNWRAEQGARALATSRGHHAVDLLVKPSFGNVVLWKSVYRWESSYFVDAVRPLVETTVFPGEQVVALEADPEWRPPPEGSRQAIDLDRFRWFSSGYLALDDEDPSRVIDLRYSMLPNRIDGLWGIRLSAGRPDEPVEFFTDRATDRSERRELLRMLTNPGVMAAGGG